MSLRRVPFPLVKRINPGAKTEKMKDGHGDPVMVNEDQDTTTGRSGQMCGRHSLAAKVS